MSFSVAIILKNDRNEEVIIRIPAGFIIERTQTEHRVQNIVVEKEYVFKLRPRERREVIIYGRPLDERQLSPLGNAEIREETIPEFTFPGRWQEMPLPLRPSTVKVPRKPGETIRQTLRAYFAPLAHTEELGIGGRELMIAMNEDLLEQGNATTEESYVTIYNPANFNFQLATGENSLSTHVLQGDIRVVEVILGCDSNYGEKLQ